MDFFSSFWPWYVCGPLIGLYVSLLYLLLNKHFGISSTFRDICAARVGPRADYVRCNWKDNRWRLLFIAGIVIGGFLSHATLTTPAGSQVCIAVLLLGISFGAILTNGEIISWFRIEEMFRFDSLHMCNQR